MTASTAPDGLESPRRGVAVATLAIGIAVTVLDASLVTVSLPAISQHFDATPVQAIWVLNAFQLAVIALLIPLASLAHRWSGHRIYLGGLAVFVLGSAACLLAPSYPVLIGARIVQGCGAAGVMCVNLSLTRSIYPAHRLARGIAFNSLVVAISSVAGPLLSGPLLALASWRGLFLLDVPLGLVALGIGIRALPASPTTRHTPFDGLSAGLSAAALILIVVATDSVRRHDGGLLTLAEMLGAALCTALLLRRQKHAEHPMVPLDLMRNRAFSLSIATAALSFAAQTIAMAAVPFALAAQTGTHLETGLLLSPWPLAVALISTMIGRLGDIYAPTTLSTIGLSLLSSGLLALTLLAHQPVAPWLMAATALCGIGFGLFQALNNSLIMSNVTARRSPAASGLQSTSRLLGQCMGAALAGVTLGSAGAADAWRALLLAAAIAITAVMCSIYRSVLQQR